MTTNLVSENKTNLLSYSCGGQKSKMGLNVKNQDVGRAVFLLGDCFSLHFSACGGFYIQWFFAFSSRHSNLLLPSSHLSTTDSDPLTPSYKDPCDYTIPSRIIQWNLLISTWLITSAKSLLPYEVTYSQVWGLGCGHLWGTIIQLPHYLSK